MKNSYKLLLVSFLLIAISATTVSVLKIKAISHQRIKVEEPSDICLSSDGHSYYIAGNNGQIAQLDLLGNVIRATKADESDYEGITVHDGKVYAIDESYRSIDVFNEATLTKIKSVSLVDGGPRNQSFEAITYLPTENKFIAITEKPVVIHELNNELQETGKIYKTPFNEVSAATYSNGQLWILSDEKRQVYAVNSKTYAIEKTYQLSILNPEGLVFDEKNSLLVLSDDLQTLFKFAPLSK